MALWVLFLPRGWLATKLIYSDYQRQSGQPPSAPIQNHAAQSGRESKDVKAREVV